MPNYQHITQNTSAEESKEMPGRGWAGITESAAGRMGAGRLEEDGK